MKRKKTGGQWGAELGGQFRWDSPEFDGKNYRTRSLNTFFEAIFQETKVLQGKKKPDFSKNSKKSGQVPEVGIEPTRL